MSFLLYLSYGVGLFFILIIFMWSVCIYELIKQGDEAKKYAEELKNYRKIESSRRRRR